MQTISMNKLPEDLLVSQFGKEKVKGIRKKKLALIAAGACLKYLNETQKLSLAHINSINYYKSQDFMALDITCRRNLELRKLERW